MASAFKLDADGDLAVEGNRLVVITQTDALAQKIETVCTAFVGEWFLALDEHIPLVEFVLRRNPNLAAIADVFTDKIGSIAGIAKVIDVEFSNDPDTRTLYLDYAVFTDAGDEITATAFPLRP